MAFTAVDGTWHNGPTFDAGELRRADGSIFVGNGSDALGARGGLVLHATNSGAVTVDGGDVVTVQPFAGVVPGNAVAGTGPYRAAIPVAQTESLAARDATNGRIDLVVFRALDTDVVGAHAAKHFIIDIIEGTPSGTPAVPTLPSMAFELARITVPASGGGAATVDSSKRIFAAAAGGILPVTTSSQLPAAAAPWQMARALDTGSLYEWNGSAWVALDAFAGTETAVFGSSPSAGRRKVRKEESVTGVIVGSGGGFTIPFDTAFANGIVSFVATPGDPGPGSVAFVRVATSGYTLGSVLVQCYTAAGAFLPNGQGVRVNYSAVGW